MNAAGSPQGFRLGVAEGVIPSTWVRRWGERVPQVPLELVALGAVGGGEAVLAGEVDAALIRSADAPAGLHLIPLFEEVPVVVVPTEHYLSAADDLTLADLAAEVVHSPVDGVRWPAAVGVPPREQVRTTREAIELVAAGAGVLVVPTSLARLHHRKDLTYRPVLDLSPTPVGLAWHVGGDLVEELIGIVRGRTPRSTRGGSAEAPVKRTAAEKAAARREYLARQRAERGSSDRGGPSDRGGSGGRGRSGRGSARGRRR